MQDYVMLQLIIKTDHKKVFELFLLKYLNGFIKLNEILNGWSNFTKEQNK